MSTKLSTFGYYEKLKNHPTTRLATGATYQGCKVPVLHYCKKCGVEFMARPENVVRRSHKCLKHDLEQKAKDDALIAEHQKEELFDFIEQLKKNEVKKQYKEMERLGLVWLKISVLLGILTWALLSAFWLSAFQGLAVSVPLTLGYWLFLFSHDKDAIEAHKEFKRFGGKL